MNHAPKPPPRLLAALALALPLLGAAAARAADGPPPTGPAPAPPADAPALPKPAAALPAGVVARVAGKDVTLDEFRLNLARRVRPELDEPRSGPSGVRRLLVEEAVVLQEAERLGIRVSNEDYGRRYDQLDRQVRERSHGEQTLADVIRLQKMSPEEFRARLEDQIRKDRIAANPAYLGATLPEEEAARLAQVEVVIGQIMRKAKVETDGLPDGVVARVNGQPITDDAFGRALYTRLAESEVRRYLNEMCLTLLLDREGLEFTEAQVGDALALDRPLYDRMHAEATSAERRALSFDDFLQLRYGAPLAELKSSRYRRGLFALRMRILRSITEDEVRAAWVRGAKGEYGPNIVLTDVQISFAIPKAVVEPVKRRPREEALRLAADYLRRVRGGEPGDAVIREIQALKDRSLVAERRAVIDQGNDIPLFEAAAALPDGGWSEPVETISEVHLLRREALRPAPTYEQVKEVVRQNLVDQKAQVWLQDTMRDQVVLAR